MECFVESVILPESVTKGIGFKVQGSGCYVAPPQIVSQHSQHEQGVPNYRGSRWRGGAMGEVCGSEGAESHVWTRK